MLGLPRRGHRCKHDLTLQFLAKLAFGVDDLLKLEEVVFQIVDLLAQRNFDTLFVEDPLLELVHCLAWV